MSLEPLEDFEQRSDIMTVLFLFVYLFHRAFWWCIENRLMRDKV